MFLLKVQLLLTGLILISLPVFSGIYQWTDADGNVHFGDNPPANIDTKLLNIEIAAPTPNLRSPKIVEPENLNINKIASQENDRLIEEHKNKKLVDKEAIKKKKLNKKKRCKGGRESMAVLQQEMPVYKDEHGDLRAAWYGDTYKGKREYLDEAARETAIDKAEQIILSNCKKPYDEKENDEVYEQWKNAQYCETAKADLKKYKLPGQKTSKDTIEKQQEQVDEYCGS